MNKRSDSHLLEEVKKVTGALGKMFAPFCEVVLHDLRSPDKASIAIENNLSGRKIGDATTAAALRRVFDKQAPDVIQNYSSRLPNGKKVKSTSTGIRNEAGEYIALLCLNFDTSFLSEFNTQLAQFIATSVQGLPVSEQLQVLTADDLQAIVEEMARQKHTTPAGLSPTEKRDVVRELHRKGLFRLRNAIGVVAQMLQVTRPTIYNYMKEI